MNKDTIYRQAAIDAIDDIESEVADGFGFQYEKWRKHFAELPPAEPKRLRGKWIYHIDDLFPAESTMECNQCHAEQPLTCDDEFCPHCGAKMEVME